MTDRITLANSLGNTVELGIETRGDAVLLRVALGHEVASWRGGVDLAKLSVDDLANLNDFLDTLHQRVAAEHAAAVLRRADDVRAQVAAQAPVPPLIVHGATGDDLTAEPAPDVTP